jgi:hypothetical protein
MSNSREILNALIQEDIVSAKKLINESLFSKLGNALEEKLSEYGPSVFNEAYKLKGKNNKVEADKKGKSKKGSKPDFLDLDKDGNRKESMKKAAKEVKEDIEMSDDMLLEEFQNEIAQIVQEIEEETGEQLTEKEIEQIAEEYLAILENTSDE